MACTQPFPTLVFTDGCPVVKIGQVYKLWTTNPLLKNILTSAASLTEWTTRISQSGAVGAGSAVDPIREWTGIGDWGARDVTDVDLPLGLVFSVPGSKVLTFTVSDLSPENRAAAAAISAFGTVGVKFWLQAADILYGGNSGINGTMRADLIIPAGRGELQSITLVITTKNAMDAGITTPHPIY